MVISKQCISQQMNRPSSVGNFNLVYRALSLLLRSLTVEFFLLYILWLQLKVQTLQASSVHVSTQSAIIKTSYYSAVKKNKTAAHTVRLYRGHIVYCSKYREWWRSRLKKYHGDRDEKKVSVGVPLGGFLIKAARRDVDFGWRAAYQPSSIESNMRAMLTTLLLVQAFLSCKSADSEPTQLITDKITVVQGSSYNDVPFTRKTLQSFVKYTAPNVIYEYLFLMPKKAIRRTDFCKKEGNKFESKFKIR